MLHIKIQTTLLQWPDRYNVWSQLYISRNLIFIKGLLWFGLVIQVVEYFGLKIRSCLKKSVLKYVLIFIILALFVFVWEPLIKYLSEIKIKLFFQGKQSNIFQGVKRVWIYVLSISLCSKLIRHELIDLKKKRRYGCFWNKNR